MLFEDVTKKLRSGRWMARMAGSDTELWARIRAFRGSPTL